MRKIKTSIATIFMLLFPFLASAASGSGWSLDPLGDFGLPEGEVYAIIENILEWLLGILGIVGIIGFIIAGIIYLISTGDETMIERAKKAMLWSIVGVIVGLMGVVIIKAVHAMLSPTSFF